MKVKDLKVLSSEDLSQKERNLRKDFFSLNNLREVGQVEKPASFRNIRRDIARILTILKERELENGNRSATK